LEGVDEAVGFVGVGGVRSYDEPTDTDPLVGLDYVERDLARSGDGDLEWPQHRWSGLGLSEVLQVLDQFASLVWRGEPAEPAIADACRSSKRCSRVTSDHDRRVRILHRCRELNDLTVRSLSPSRSRSRPEFSHPSQAVVGSTSPCGHRDTKRRQLPFDVAHTDTDDQTPLRQDV
jgi:hypothetical protein